MNTGNFQITTQMDSQERKQIDAELLLFWSSFLLLGGIKHNQPRTEKRNS